MFKITPETPTKTVEGGIVIVSGPGGCPWVTDPENPHLGGNFDGGDLGTMYQKGVGNHGYWDYSGHIYKNVRL